MIMLVRSASTPVLNSFVSHHATELSPEHDLLLHIPKPHSMTLVTRNGMSRASSENDLRDLAVPKRKSGTLCFNGVMEEVEAELAGEEEQDLGLNSRPLMLDRIFSSSGLDELVEESELIEGGKNGSLGDRSNGGNGDGGESSGFSNSDEENNRTDAYYKKMIQENPGNALLLGNYAKFLKEVLGNVIKAEEYCERAILANPNDGNVVSMYADLMWEAHRDASRADKYFNQAVEAAPEDSYVMASYARFLWDAEEEEEEEETGSWEVPKRPPGFLQGTYPSLISVSYNYFFLRLLAEALLSY